MELLHSTALKREAQRQIRKDKNKTINDLYMELEQSNKKRKPKKVF